MPEIPAPEVRVTRYEVSCVPPDDINALGFTLTVQWRGGDRWAVLDGPFALDADGVKDYGPRSSSCEDDWLALHRFDEQTALKLAREHAPKMTVNGWTVADALAARENRNA